MNDIATPYSLFGALKRLASRVLALEQHVDSVGGGGGGGGSDYIPESFPILSFADTTTLDLSGTSSSFQFPTPVPPDGKTYRGMRITFTDILTVVVGTGASAAQAGTIELPIIHAWEIAGMAHTPLYFYARHNCVSTYDPAGGGFTINVALSGSLYIAAAEFTPDGSASLTFTDNTAGLGFRVPDYIYDVIPYTLDTATSEIHPGVNILAEYVYS